MKVVNAGLIMSVMFVFIFAFHCPAEEMSLSDSIRIKSDYDILYAQEGDPGLSVNEDEIEEEEDFEYLEELEYEDDIDVIADPLEPVNRLFFQFNDRLYFWVLKPVAKGYAALIPEELRISVKNFFVNISVPIRVINNLLQFKIKSAGTELLRFGINSTAGMLGLFDYAKDEMGIRMQDEDFGQTLGVWGLDSGFYIVWPILGPSSLRDSAGYAGDYFLDPLNYIRPATDRIVIRGGERINRTSLAIGDYEKIKKDALDPYDAVKDIYYQYRESQIGR